MTVRSTCAEFDRRKLGRMLSHWANASVAEVLDALAKEQPTTLSSRIGVTGAPGVGKSTLIGRLAQRRIEKAGRLGVVAIDPTSPLTGGSVLGDRLRMDALVEDARFYVRSFPSRAAQDGLTHNLPQILNVMDAYDFSEVIIETTGVGQVEYAVRALVDAEILVLAPESGDYVQAMKAGILETADIYVVNKGDLPGADRLEALLQDIVVRRGTPRGGCPPALVRLKPDDEIALSKLDAALDKQLAGALVRRDPTASRRQRCRLQVQSLVQRQLAELLDALPAEALDQLPADVHARVLAELASSGSPTRIEAKEIRASG